MFHSKSKNKERKRGGGETKPAKKYMYQELCDQTLERVWILTHKVIVKIN